MFASLITAGCGNNPKKGDEKTIKIGAVIPLTGNAAVLGDYTLKGLQLAVQEQNDKGGLLGKKIELEVQDSKADPKEGVNIIKNMLAEDHKPFLVYSIMSGVTMAIKPETEKNNILLMSAVGTDKFLENSKYTIRDYVAATTIGQNISEYSKDSLKVSNLFIFYSNNEYGASVKDAVKKYCQQQNIVTSSEPYDEKSTDYKSLIAARIDKKVSCIYVAGVGKGLGTMIKQIRESGYAGKMIGDQLITFPDVIKVAGSALKGMPYLDFAFDPGHPDAGTKNFIDAFYKRFKTNPQNFSVITYDGINLLFNTIEKSKFIDNTKLIESLNETKDYQGVFGPVSVTDRNVNFVFHFKKMQ